MTFRDTLFENFANLLLGERLPLDIVDSETGDFIVPANRKITRTMLRKMVHRSYFLEIDPSPVRNRILQVVSETEKQFQPYRIQLPEEMAEGVKNGYLQAGGFLEFLATNYSDFTFPSGKKPFNCSLQELRIYGQKINKCEVDKVDGVVYIHW